MSMVPMRRAELWEPLRQIQREMDQVMQRMVGENLGGDGPGRIAAWVPRIDIEEAEKEFTVKADLPGIDPKNVDISMVENTLIIRGHTESVREEHKDYHRVERFEGQFYREITLPQGINSDEIEASAENGVLTIRIPKKEESHPKKISVRTKEQGAQQVQQQAGKQGKASAKSRSESASSQGA